MATVGINLIVVADSDVRENEMCSIYQFVATLYAKTIEK